MHDPWELLFLPGALLAVVTTTLWTAGLLVALVRAALTSGEKR